MKITFLKTVRLYFEKLIPKLHDLGYFSYNETAKRYVEEIFTEIEKQLPFQIHRPAPVHFENMAKA